MDYKGEFTLLKKELSSSYSKSRKDIRCMLKKSCLLEYLFATMLGAKNKESERIPN